MAFRRTCNKADIRRKSPTLLAVPQVVLLAEQVRHIWPDRLWAEDSALVHGLALLVQRRPMQWVDIYDC
jgi:hypothetical protein